MPVSCCQSEEIESTRSLLSALSERMQAAYADLARQSNRLDALRASFEKQKLALSPTAYAAAASELEQQELITQNARHIAEDSERRFALAQQAEDQQRLAAEQQQKRAALGRALEQKTAEINQLQAQLGQLPERIAHARQEHARLQVEWGKLA
jgi:chromosome segregation ATPase